MKAYLKKLIALHVEKNTLTQIEHFLLMDLCKIFSINEYSNQIAYKKKCSNMIKII